MPWEKENAEALDGLAQQIGLKMIIYGFYYLVSAMEKPGKLTALRYQ